jgi:hypothetical protein
MLEAVAAQRPRRWLRRQGGVEKTIAVVDKQKEDSLIMLSPVEGRSWEVLGIVGALVVG